MQATEANSKRLTDSQADAALSVSGVLLSSPEPASANEALSPTESNPVQFEPVGEAYTSQSRRPPGSAQNNQIRTSHPHQELDTDRAETGPCEQRAWPGRESSKSGKTSETVVVSSQRSKRQLSGKSDCAAEEVGTQADFAEYSIDAQSLAMLDRNIIFSDGDKLYPDDLPYSGRVSEDEGEIKDFAPNLYHNDFTPINLTASGRYAQVQNLNMRALEDLASLDNSRQEDKNHESRSG